LWGLLGLGVAIAVGLRPEAHTVTPEYRGAAEKWFRGEDVYTLQTIHGYLYSPSSTLLYWPITLLPLVPGEILWRLLIVGSLALAVWRLTELVLGKTNVQWFGLVTLLTIPACFSSARNGQTNMPLAACMVFAVVALADRRWGWAAFWLAVTVWLKPVAMVIVLLGLALYPPLRVRLMVGLLAVMALPWLNLDWHYVWREHVLFLQKMALASAPKEDVFYDLRGMLIQMGFHPQDSILTIIRAAAGGGVLYLAWQASRAQKDERRAAFLVGALSAAYLMIFSPRTETNSYVILAPFIAVLAVRKGLLEGLTTQSVLLGLLAITLGTDSYGSFIFHSTNLWLKVLSALIFLAMISYDILRKIPWTYQIQKTKT
jgi:hypothetical protein